MSDLIYLTIEDPEGRPVYGNQVIITAFLPDGPKVIYSGIYRNTIRISISQITSSWRENNEKTKANGSLLIRFPVEIEVIDIRTYATDVKYIEIPVDAKGPLIFTISVKLRAFSEIAEKTLNGEVQPMGESCTIHSDLVYRNVEWRRINIADLMTSQHSTGHIAATVKQSWSGSWGVRVIWSFGAGWEVGGLFSWSASYQNTAGSNIYYNSEGYVSMPFKLVYEKWHEWNYCGLDRYKEKFYVGGVDFSGLRGVKGDDPFISSHYSYKYYDYFVGQGTSSWNPSYDIGFLTDVVDTESFSIPVPLSFIADISGKIPSELIPDLEIYNDRQSCMGTAIHYTIWADRGYTVYIYYMSQNYYDHPATKIKVSG